MHWGIAWTDDRFKVAVDGLVITYHGRTGIVSEVSAPERVDEMLGRGYLRRMGDELIVDDELQR